MMNRAASPGQRTDALANRTRLLEAALQAFAQFGLDLEVQDVASQAQVGVGTLYRHFGNREGLLRAIINAIVDDLLTQLRLAVSSSAGDPRAAFFALVSVGLRLQQRYRSIFFVLRDPRMAKLFERPDREARRAQLLEPIKSVIEQGIQRGLLRQDLDPELAAEVIFGALPGVFESLVGRYPLAELERRLAQLLWMMVHSHHG
jgi:AcrR family transcriptional regulator